MKTRRTRWIVAVATGRVEPKPSEKVGYEPEKKEKKKK